MTMKIIDMCGIQIGGTLPNDEDYEITYAKNINSSNDFFISKRQK